jgi:hypothetical protein
MKHHASRSDCRTDSQSVPRRPSIGLSPADRGGVGIRLPVRYDDQSLPRSLSLLDGYAWYQRLRAKASASVGGTSTPERLAG